VSFLKISTVSFLSANQNTFFVDDFESDIVAKEEVWGASDNLNVVRAQSPRISFGNRQAQQHKAGKYSLSIRGKYKEYKIGTVNRRVDIDVSSFSHLRLMVFNTSGVTKKLVFKMQNLTGKSKSTNKYTLHVDWIGWKYVVIPLSKITNKDIEKTNKKHSGLLQIDFSSVKKGNAINMAIDNVEFIKVETF
jgi:hypothetical protein